MGLGGLFKNLGQSTEQKATARALALYAKGDIERAIEVLKEAHSRAPEDTGILFELAPLLAQAGRTPEAAEMVRTILRRSPKSIDRTREMIEEVRARRVNVSALNDAVVEHFIRLGDLQAAATLMERIPQSDIKNLMPRHQGRWNSVRKNAPDAKMARASLQSAYYLAITSEVLRDYAIAAEIYRTVARNNPEESDRVLARFEVLLAKDYHNAPLRVAVADLFLRSGREQAAVQQFSLALETDRQSAGSVAEAVSSHLTEKGDRPDLRWILAMSYMVMGRVDEAVESMEILVDAGVQLAEIVEVLRPLAATDAGRGARRLLARALVRSGQSQSALDTLMQVSEEEGLASVLEPLESLAASTPEMARSHLLLGDSYVAAGRIPDAVLAMRRALEAAPGEKSILFPKVTGLLEKNPSSPDAHLLLADLQIGSGERERGIVVLRHMVREDPESAGQAIEMFTPLMTAGAVSPRALIGAAEACIAAGKHQEALQHLSEVARSNPELSAEFLHVVGLLSESAPDVCPAVMDMLRALEPLSPLPHAVRFALGDAAFHGGDPASAAAAFRGVMEAAPERIGEVQQALERFDRDDPRAAEARYLLAMLYLDQRQHDAAIAELSRGESVNPALLDRVLARYDSILAKSPDDNDALCGFVQTLLMGRHYDRVLTAGQEAISKVDPGRAARITLAMGDALCEKGDSDDAAKRYFAAYGRDHSLVGDVVERLKALTRTEGTHALASLALGKVMTSEKQAPEAVEAFQAASAADPKLRDTVLTELHGLMVSCPADPRPGVMALALMLEMRDTHRALQMVGSLLDSHPDLASVLVGHLETILASEPEHPKALFEMGRGLQRLKLFPRSAASYLAAARKEKTMIPPVMKRLQQITAAAPGCPDPYLAIASIQAGIGKFQAAAETLSEATEKSAGDAGPLLPRLEEVWRQNRGNGRIALLFGNSCLRAGLHDKAIAAFGEAAQRKEQAIHDPALEGLEKVLEANPKLADGYVARGRAHRFRMRLDRAVRDFEKAYRLAPHLLPEILQDTETIHQQSPDSMPTAILLADLYIAGGREAEAGTLLETQLGRAHGAAERLAIRIRLWRLALSRRDEEAAREHLIDAMKLAPDRNRFLIRVHEVHVAALRSEAALLGEGQTQGRQRAADMSRAVHALIELGEIEEASFALDRLASVLDTGELMRLRAEIALRRGDYPRASETLRTLGPSMSLAFGADRGGDHALAAQTLENLALENDDPRLQISLSRVYRAMVVADLARGSRRLQAETVLTFGEGNPA